jgi:hypothetical protein
MEPLLNKISERDLLKPENQKAYVLETHNAFDLLQKEVDINHAEQELLSKRIQMMKNFVNDLPSCDSEYSMMMAQIQMDLIELDEIKRREEAISKQLHELSKPKHAKISPKKQIN